MAFWSLLAVVTLFWIIIHAISRRYERHHDSTRSSQLLPIASSGKTSNNSNLLRRIIQSRYGTLEIGPLWLKYETTRLNSLFSNVSLLFSKNGLSLTERKGSTIMPFFARLIDSFYSFGAAFCVLALVLGWAVLFVTVLRILWTPISWIFGEDRAIRIEDSVKPVHLVRESMQRLSKRFYQDGGITRQAVATGNDEPEIHTLIPGVTVPLSELPILFLVLAFSGVIHELGHAITAALSSLPVLSTGFHIHLLLPTFFVSIPMDNAHSDTSKLRIATAGAWHNIVTYIILALLGLSSVDFGFLSPLGSVSDKDSVQGDVCRPDTCGPTSVRTPFILSLLGYTTALGRGIVVTRVDTESPLYGQLAPGSILKSVDDVYLGSLQFGIESWRSYLSTTEAEYRAAVDKGAGWCIPEPWFDAQPTDCCTPEYQITNNDSGSKASRNSTVHHSHGSQSCFISSKRFTNHTFSSNVLHTQKCLDPVSLFTHQHILAQGGTPPHPPFPTPPSNPRSVEGSAYGSRCQISCLAADRDISNYLCVKPTILSDADEQETRLLRLEIEEAFPRLNQEDGIPSRILVYRGPPSEILDHIGVGYILPSFFLPISFSMAIIALFTQTIPAWNTLLWDYLARLSLSLAAFNLLPIQGLDGGVVSSILIQWVLSGKQGFGRGKRDDIELQRTGYEGEQGSNNEAETRNRWNADAIERGVSICTVILSIVAGLAAIWRDVG